MNNPNHLYTSEDVARLMQLSIETVWKKCRNLEWPHMRVGRHYRFSDDDLVEIREMIRPAIVRPARRGKRMPL